jgi:hypothetical protein
MKIIEIPETREEAMTILRKAWPAMRRTYSTAIIHSGGKQTIFGCICGSRHTTSTDWNGREAKHVREWEAEHANCCISLATRYQKGIAVSLSFGR